MAANSDHVLAFCTNLLNNSCNIYQAFGPIRNGRLTVKPASVRAKVNFTGVTLTKFTKVCRACQFRCTRIWPMPLKHDGCHRMASGRLIEIAQTYTSQVAVLTIGKQMLAEHKWPIKQCSPIRGWKFGILSF